MVGFTHGDKINTDDFYRGLDALFAEKDIRQTRQYMEDWLMEAERINDLQGIIAVCNELGGLYRAMGDTARAIEQHNRVLLILEQIGLSETEHYATALINLGDVYIMTEDFNKALSVFLKAENLLIECGLKGDYRMAALYNNISIVYKELDRTEDAENALEKAFLIIKGIKQCRGELATTCINLGKLQVKQGKLTMAKETLLKGIEIFEEDGGRDVHYAAALAAMGELHFINREYEEAANCYEKAIANFERDFGKTPLLEKLKGNLALARSKRTKAEL